MTDRSLTVEQLRTLTTQFFSTVPHNTRLGIEILELTDGRARARLPYSGELVGDPIRGVLHGGVITTLMDTTAGMAAFMALDGPTPLATLDLRIDYLTKATPEKDVIARAQVTRVTRSIVFVSGAAFHEEDQPIATCAATFMLHTTIRRTADSTRGTR